ncbi:MAG TPA: hypothetical protein VII06_08960 [Chloroflexota bacterium]
MEQLAEYPLTPNADLSIDGGHATCGFVSSINEWRIKAHPVVERIGAIKPLELLDGQPSGPTLAELRFVLRAAAKRTSKQIEVAFVLVACGGEQV